MEDKTIRYQACLPGVLDSIGFDIFALKDPDYTMTVMSTYGQLVAPQGQKDNVRNVHLIGSTNDEKITFKYTEVFANHFQYCGAVDDHNNKHHYGNGGHQVSLETTWKTTRWELHVAQHVRQGLNPQKEVLCKDWQQREL
eukprot:330892-Ditylum_brightwellii.AAC.1